MHLRGSIPLFVAVAFLAGIVPLSAWAFWGNENSTLKRVLGPALFTSICSHVREISGTSSNTAGLPAAMVGGYMRISTLRYREQTRLGKIWDSWENQYEADIERFIKETRADVEIICERTARPEAVGLSCTSTALSSGKHVGEGRAVFPQKDIVTPEILDIAVTALAKDLLVDLEAAKPAKLGVLLDMNSGSSSELANFLGKRLLAALNPMLIAEQRQEKTKGIGPGGEGR